MDTLLLPGSGSTLTVARVRRVGRWPSVMALSVCIIVIAGCGRSGLPSAPATGASSNVTSPRDAVGTVVTSAFGLPAVTGIDEDMDAAYRRWAGGSEGPPVLVVWDAAGDYLYVITSMGTSCANGVERVTKTGPQQLEILTRDALDGSSAPRSCTADFRPLTSSVVVPPGILRSQSLSVIVDGLSVVVPAQD